MDYNSILRDRLNALIDQRGIKQNWLADESGVDASTISKYRSGTVKPNMEYTAKLAKALGVSLDYLLGFAPLPNSGNKMDEDIAALISAYGRADAHAQKMVWMQLEPYMTDREKGFAPYASNEQKSENVG